MQLRSQYAQLFNCISSLSVNLKDHQATNSASETSGLCFNGTDDVSSLADRLLNKLVGEADGVIRLIRL